MKHPARGVSGEADLQAMADLSQASSASSSPKPPSMLFQPNSLLWLLPAPDASRQPWDGSSATLSLVRATPYGSTQTGAPEVGLGPPSNSKPFFGVGP
jgi:hypothetical protein